MTFVILKELRINHYIKNLVVFIPFIFDRNIVSTITCIRAFLLFCSFCFIASAVYIINDLKDKKEDRCNPHKKRRPLAANLITNGQAYVLLITLLSGSFLIASYLKCSSFIVAYLFLNILYSYFLRQIFYVDACSIAFGFILRLLASFSLFEIPVNFVILLWMFFTSCFFTFIKRKLELNTTYNRKALIKVNRLSIQNIILLNGILSVLCCMVAIFHCFGIGQYALILFIYSLILIRVLILSDKIHNFSDPANFIKEDYLLKILLFLLLVTFYYP